jgi:hypothetical protein
MSMQETNQGEEGNKIFKISDGNDSEVFFVVDEVGSDHDDPAVSEGDEPEVVFVKEEIYHLVPDDSTAQLNENVTTTKIPKEDQNDEPEIIFSSESPALKSETVCATSDKPFSTEQDKPVTTL